MIFYIMQVFDDIVIELTMALLQFFSEKPSEEHLFRALKSLGKFITVRTNLFGFNDKHRKPPMKRTMVR